MDQDARIIAQCNANLEKYYLKPNVQKEPVLLPLPPVQNIMEPLQLIPVQNIIEQPEQILEEEEDLLAMIQKLKASLEQEQNKNIEKDIQLKDKDVQIADLTKENKDVNDRFKQSQEIIQELKVDKFDLRGTIEILKQSNQDKVVKIEDVKKLLHEKEAQYDALKIQYDNIMDIGMEQNEDMQNVPVLGGNHESSQSNSFELI